MGGDGSLPWVYLRASRSGGMRLSAVSPGLPSRGRVSPPEPLAPVLAASAPAAHPPPRCQRIPRGADLRPGGRSCAPVLPAFRKRRGVGCQPGLYHAHRRRDPVHPAVHPCRLHHLGEQVRGAPGAPVPLPVRLAARGPCLHEHPDLRLSHHLHRGLGCHDHCGGRPPAVHPQGQRVRRKLREGPAHRIREHRPPVSAQPARSFSTAWSP